MAYDEDVLLTLWVREHAKRDFYVSLEFSCAFPADVCFPMNTISKECFQA